MIPKPMRAAAACVAAALVLATAGCSGPTSHPAVGRELGRLPIAAVADPAAAPPGLVGKVTLLNFWGTWCPPCRRELPGLARLASRLADDRRFQLIAVSCNPGPDDFETVATETREFLTRQRIELAAWAFADPVGRELVFSTIGLSAFPTTLLVGPDGRVRRIWIGYRPRDEAEIAAVVVALLKEQPAVR